MGCNCKASQYVRQTQKKFGYNPPTRENIPKGVRVKMGLQAIGIWILTIISSPILLLFPLLVSFFKKNRKIKFFNTITVRF